MANITSKQLRTGVIELVDPNDGNGLHVFLELMGPEHPDRINYDLERANGVRRDWQKKKKMGLGDAAEEREAAIAKAIFCVVRWWDSDLWDDEAKVGKADTIVIDPGYGELTFSEANKNLLLRDPDYAWIRDQVIEGLGDSEVFIKPASKR